MISTSSAVSRQQSAVWPASRAPTLLLYCCCTCRRERRCNRSPTRTKQNGLKYKSRFILMFILRRSLYFRPKWYDVTAPSSFHENQNNHVTKEEQTQQAIFSPGSQGRSSPRYSSRSWRHYWQRWCGIASGAFGALLRLLLLLRMMMLLLLHSFVGSSNRRCCRPAVYDAGRSDNKRFAKGGANGRLHISQREDNYGHDPTKTRSPGW